MKRRLIVCCDGTWQNLEQEDRPNEEKCLTNVAKIAQAIKLIDNTNDRHIDQIVYYDEGLGTPQVDSKFIDTLIKLEGGAFGLGIHEKIEEAYLFLCLNYEPEDEIYLFGFSRGAYIVRCLAGLIYNCGLLRRECISKVPEAYKIYRDKKVKSTNDYARWFRKEYAHHVKQYPDPDFYVPIKALCCWDTVASLGIPDVIPFLNLDEKFNEKYGFFDHTVNRTVEKAFHAVAIDEIYKTFNVTLMKSDSDREKEQVTQVWFPGCHGCIGGGCEKDCGLSDEALHWMIQEVTKLGLAIDENCIEGGIDPDYSTVFDNTPKWPFNLGGTKPRIFKGDFSNLHESVKDRWLDPNINPPYEPAIREIQKMLEKELGALRQKELALV